MNPVSVRQLFDLSLIIIMVGVPFVVLIYPQFPFGFFSFRRRMIITMLSGWIFIIVLEYLQLRYCIMHPFNGEVRWNLAEGLMFYIGWLPMILGAIPSLTICAIDDYRRKHGRSGVIKPFKNNPAEQAGGCDGEKPHS